MSRLCARRFAPMHKPRHYALPVKRMLGLLEYDQISYFKYSMESSKALKNGSYSKREAKAYHTELG